MAAVLAAAAAPSARADAQLRGSNIHLYTTGTTLTDTSRQLALLRTEGAGVVRLGLPWALLETGRGAWSGSAVKKFDDFLKQASSNGIKVVALFSGTPCWASSAPASVKGNCSGYGQYGTPWYWAGAYPPTDNGDLSYAVRWVMRRWGTKLAGFEFWNEPNVSSWLTAPDPAAAYTSMLKAAYPAAKQAAPSVPVIAGALAFADGEFLSELYKDGVQAVSDAISAHPYNVRFDSFTGTGDPTQPWADGCDASCKKYTFSTGVPWLHDVMTANGDGAKPLWLTEFGFSNCSSAGALCVSDQQQADWLSASFRTAAQWPYVKTVISYTARDTGTDRTSWNENFGVIRWDYSTKPAYDAVKATWSQLAAASQTAGA